MKSRKLPAPDEAQIQEVKEKYEEKLLLLPNVAGIGIGYKITKGIQENYFCLKIYVSKKITSKKLSKDQIIPEQLDGIQTDVEEIGNVKAHKRY